MRLTEADARAMGLAAPAARNKKPQTNLADGLLKQIGFAKLPPPEREWRFHPRRRWRFDLAYPGRMIAIECEGLTSPQQDRKSRHTTWRGYSNDCEKYDQAILLGWRLFRFTNEMIRNGRALEMLELALSIWPEPLSDGDGV